MLFHYLHHSGVYLETANNIFIFDYDKAVPAGHLEQGVIDPQQLPKDKSVFVLASHSHHDHFLEQITDWAKYPNFKIILANDIKAYPNCDTVEPNKTYNYTDIANNQVTVQTLNSTDKGVAYLVKADSKAIYHAGDLNWWHWSGETDAYNQKMEQDYKSYLAPIHGQDIDIAFLPVDPRQESDAFLGIEHFWTVTNVALTIPIHLWGKYTKAEELKSQHPTKNILTYKARGDRFNIQ